MAMTKIETIAKDQVMDLLGKQGYPTYARLLKMFDLNLTSDPGVIGYMQVDKARIVLNKGLSINQVSTIVRHEILHEYLTHFARSEKYKKEKNKNLPHDLVNIAADLDISNTGYTDADKVVAKSIILNNQLLKGLVTEIDFPDWQDKSFEEMLDLLSEKYEDVKNMISQSIQIGDIGDQNIQDAEEIERQANAVSNDAGEKIDSDKPGSENAEDYQDIKDAADNISKKAKQAEEQAKELSNSDNVFPTDEEKDQQEKIAKRIQDLKNALNDAMNKQSILDETSENISKDQLAKKARDLKRYKESALIKFKDSLNNFIKNEIATGRGATWTRINKKYSGSGIIKPGSSRLQQTNVPLINVYFDRSGSWDSSKTAEGAKTISTLNKYVNQNKIKVNLYYFSNNVHSEESAAIQEGGTEGQPILEHIEATKPTNVIILTDSDISDCTSYVTIPGGVWMLFYQGRSNNLMEHLKGRKLTKYFDIM